MSETRELAVSMVDHYGLPDLTTHDEACAWIADHWPDWFDFIGTQMRDNVAEWVVRLVKAERKGGE